METMPWWHVGNRNLHNPFQSLGLDWCPRCKMAVDTDTFAEHSGTCFAYKKICCRCGRPVCYGVWDNVAVITNRPLQRAAYQWVFEPGQDRR